MKALSLRVLVELSQITKRLELWDWCDISIVLPGYPTWLPNLTVATTTVIPYGTNSFPFATGFSAAEYDFPTLRILEVTGIRCALVTQVVPSSLATL